MTFESGGSTEVGGVKFGVGLDLQQLAKDLDKAEQLAKQRADKIQSILGNIGVGSTATKPAGGKPKTTTSAGAAAAGIATAGTQQSADQVYSQLIADGHPTDIAANAVSSAFGVQPSGQIKASHKGAKSSTDVAAATQKANDAAQRAAERADAALQRQRSSNLLRASQRRARALGTKLSQPYQEGEARREGRAFTRISTGQQIGLTPPEHLQAYYKKLLDQSYAADNKDDAEFEARAKKAASTRNKRDASEYAAARRDASKRSSTPAGEYDRDQQAKAGLWAQRVPIEPPDEGGDDSGGSSGGRRGLSTTNIVRIAAGFAGVTLGINIAAGAARQMHKVVSDIVDVSLQLVQTGRQIGTSFGAASGQVISGANAFLANPSTRGTLSQAQGAAAGLGPIASQYGLATTQVNSLVVAEGQLARLHGVELPQAGQILENVLRGNVEAGQALDLQLTDQYGRLKLVGLSFDELVNSVGRLRAEQILAAAVHADVARQLTNDASQSNVAASALDKLQKAWDNFRSRVGPSEQTVAGVANFGTNVLTPHPTVEQQSPMTALLSRFIPGFALLAPFLPKTQVTNPLAIRAALDAQTAPLLANETAAGPGAVVPTQVVPTAAEQRSKRLSDAQERVTRSAIESRQAQARIDVINAQSEQRRLSQQQRINTLAQQQIDIQNQLAPSLLEEASLRDKITIAQRENLGLTKERITAEQAALPTSAALTALNFRETQAIQKATVSAIDKLQGRTPTYDTAAQIQEIMAVEYAKPRAELANTQTQRQVQLAQEAQQADQLRARQLSLPYEGQLQGVQGQIMSGQQAQRANQAQADVIARALQTADLAASPDRIAAETQSVLAAINAAQATGQLAAAQLEAGPAPTIVNQLTVSASVSVNQALLDQIQAAMEKGSLEGILAAKAALSGRVSTDVPGGR